MIGKNTDVMRAARIEEGAVIGDECLVGEESIIQGNVRVYPFKTIEAGAVVNTSRDLGVAGPGAPVRRRAASPGILNVEITPELAVRLAGAYATTLKKGATVTTARDHSRGARALKRAVISRAAGQRHRRRDLENVPLPVARQQTARGSAGGIMIRTTPGRPGLASTSCSSTSAAPTSPQAGQRKLDRVFARQEYRRAFPGEIGDLHFPASVFDSYTGDLLRSVDTTGIAEAGLKVVVDASNGSAGAGAAQPARPARRGRADHQPRPRRVAARPRRPSRAASGPGAARRDRGLRRGPRSACGSTRSASGSRWSTRRGRIVEDDRALLVLLDLVAAERRSGRVALPVTTTRIAEQVGRVPRRRRSSGRPPRRTT